MFFLLAVWSLSFETWFFQGILHNHMGGRERRGKADWYMCIITSCLATALRSGRGGKLEESKTFLKPE